MPTNKATPADAGCWVGGHWGQYAVARMIQLAEEWGYRGDQLCALAYRHLAQQTPYDIEPLDADEWQILHDGADEVETWLNENVAPEGFHFTWDDGEFFLRAEEDDAED